MIKKRVAWCTTTHYDHMLMLQRYSSSDDRCSVSKSYIRGGHYGNKRQSIQTVSQTSGNRA